MREPTHATAIASREMPATATIPVIARSPVCGELVPVFLVVVVAAVVVVVVVVVSVEVSDVVVLEL